MNDKRPFDYIEEKIKEAAESNHPAFDEKAWEAMCLKLDREQKRRRPFFWWWIGLPVLIGAAWAGYQWMQPTAAQHPGTASAVIQGASNTNEYQNENDRATTSPAGKPGGTVNNTDDLKQHEKEPVTGMDNVAPVYTVVPNAGANKNTAEPPAKTGIASHNAHQQRKVAAKRKGRLTAHSMNAIATDEASLPGEQGDGGDLVPAVQKQSTNTVSSVTDEGRKEITGGTPVKKTDSNVAIVLHQPTDSLQGQQSGNSKNSGTKKTPVHRGFYLLAAGGADAGSTKLLSLGNSTITPKFGLGLGYTINRRLSVQSGLYISNKKYLAFAGDYHPKPGSYFANVEMHEVKAACLVYEIPVTIRYNVAQLKSLRIYGTVGASSYIMQTEDYDYYYTAYNYPYEKEWQYTGNKHLFSTGSFSIGIEKQLSKKVFLLAEPSVSIPLSGVGEGSVKLYSTALLVALRYNLFK